MQRIVLLILTIAIGFIPVRSQNVLKVQSGAIIKTTGGVTITLQDMNLDNDGTIDQGNFRFSGTVNNAVSGNSTPIFDLLEIAKTGAAKLTLQRGITIANSIQFSSGVIDLNNNNILLQTGALLNGESETSRIIGPNGGYIEIATNLNNPSGINPGNLGAIITSSQNLGSTVIRRGHIVQSGGGLSTSIQRYFDIVPANNTGLNATLRFKYFDAELNGLDESTLVMWKSPDNVVWANQSFTSRDAAGNYVERNSIGDFSRWALSTAFNTPLPVRFMLFNVRCEGSRVMIHWKTAQEINASYFEIQRSSNGSDWTTIGTLPAVGNSSMPQSYNFVDNSPLMSAALYRIAEFDLDGKKQYTSINRSDCGDVETWKAWPNPVAEQLFFNISVVNSSQAMIRIYDNIGAFIKEQRNTLMTGSNQLNVDMKNLPSGTYHVVTTWNNGQNQKTVKIIKR